MNLIINPPRKEWPGILQRPVFDAKSLLPMVQEVLDAIQEKEMMRLRLIRFLLIK